MCQRKACFCRKHLAVEEEDYEAAKTIKAEIAQIRAGQRNAICSKATQEAHDQPVQKVPRPDEAPAMPGCLLIRLPIPP